MTLMTFCTENKCEWHQCRFVMRINEINDVLHWESKKNYDVFDKTHFSSATRGWRRVETRRG